MLSFAVKLPRASLSVLGRTVPVHLASMTAASASTAPEAVSVRPVAEIPGPKGWPLVGSLPEMIMNKGKAGDDLFWHKYYLQYGPIYKLKGIVGVGSDSVVISDPEAAATMMRAEGKYPSRMVEENMMWIYRKNNLPYAMFFSGGKEWKRIRSAGKKQIIPRRVGNYASALGKFANQFGDHLYSIRNPEGCVVDVQTEMMKYAFQGVSYFVFNETLDVYSGKDENVKEFQKAGIEFIESLSMIASALPLYKLYPTKAYRNYVQKINAVQELGRQVMKRKHKELKAAIEKGVIDDTKAVGLLEQWLVEGNFTEEEALMQSSDMMAVGIDTTSNTSTFLLHEVAKNPDLQDKLYKEVTSVLSPDQPPTFEDIQKMQLVRSCAKETLRLYPALPILPRKIAEDVVILGYLIPAETPALFNMYSTSRNPQHFADPLSFKPERWSRDESTEVNNPFSSLPFGFGPRSCYGRRLAELEIHVLLIQLIRQFQLSTEQQSLKTRQGTVLKPDEPVIIKLTKR